MQAAGGVPRGARAEKRWNLPMPAVGGSVPGGRQGGPARSGLACAGLEEEAPACLCGGHGKTTAPSSPRPSTSRGSVGGARSRPAPSRRRSASPSALTYERRPPPASALPSEPGNVQACLRVTAPPPYDSAHQYARPLSCCAVWFESRRLVIVHLARNCEVLEDACPRDLLPLPDPSPA